jgi:hypothetical protein
MTTFICSAIKKRDEVALIAFEFPAGPRLFEAPARQILPLLKQIRPQ